MMMNQTEPLNSETGVSAEFDWRNDPYFLSFADHMIAAMNLVWAHEQKLAREQAQAGAPSAEELAQFEQAKREAVETGARRVALVKKVRGGRNGK